MDLELGYGLVLGSLRRGLLCIAWCGLSVAFRYQFGSLRVVW